MTDPRKSGALVLAAGFLVLFIGGGARFSIGLTLKPMVDELHWTRGDIGLAVAMFQIVSAVTLYFAGRMADKVSLRLVLGGGLVVSAIGIGGMYAVMAPWHALALYGLVFAIGNGIASIPPVGVMVTRAFPGRAGLANAVATSGLSVGQLAMIAAATAALGIIGWRAVYVGLGAVFLLLLPFVLIAVPAHGESHGARAPLQGLTMREAARTRAFWLLLGIYAICGFDDFFVTTHVVAFAQDKGLAPFLAGNLLALMGLTGLLGVLMAGWVADKKGPCFATAAAFAGRVAVFALIMVDQSPLSVAFFGLVFGATFLVTAPLTMLFVRQYFGVKNLGGLSGFITMVHHISGGIGAYLGAAIFDATGGYDAAFLIMLAASLLALVLTVDLKRVPMPGAQTG